MNHPLIPTAIAPREPAQEQSNVWPAPNPIVPGTPGWDAELILRLSQFCERFDCYLAEAFAWDGYLKGETHAEPKIARSLVAHPSNGDRAVA